MKTALLNLEKKEVLTPDQMTAAMEALVTGRATDHEIENFLTLLREKGETAAEIVAAAKVMRMHALRLSKHLPGLLDTCGTGGDGQHTLNVSTLSALTASAAGVPVAKHGNRSVSSVCGSADILELLGVRIELAPEALERCLESTGFAFFFAPKFHPATRFAMPARKKIQGKTLFNLLGPLANPAGVDYQVIGVYEKRLVLVMAEALAQLGLKKAWTLYGLEGLDEISIAGPTSVAEIEGGRVKTFMVSPEDAGFKRSSPAGLRCESKEAARDLAQQVLRGTPGPAQDAVALNSGAGLYVAGKAASFKAGAALARETLVSGAVLKKLEEIVLFTRGVAV